MMKEEGLLVVWPASIDKNRTRAEGRKISRKHAVPEPDTAEIEKAAKFLGLNPVIEKDCAYPKSWWEKSGRVLIRDKGSKPLLLRQIAARIKESRN